LKKKWRTCRQERFTRRRRSLIFRVDVEFLREDFRAEVGFFSRFRRKRRLSSRAKAS